MMNIYLNLCKFLIYLNIFYMASYYLRTYIRNQALFSIRSLYLFAFHIYINIYIYIYIYIVKIFINILVNYS